ncbi:MULTISPECIES: heavy-metal-associated domain-containing protein [unclassified Streptomyces]|uniref:heavy-metal-associated domain-containing protein n=1 Tax=unclassified Streptomyces TaxID=2593676 RepID=UPI000701D9AD|nr:MULTISPECIES: heavy-metal-associated domain-containing protein [unclassified Streptomyces]KQX59393.1 copper-binding protein [Streptomyces sp. Root1304]KRB00654.1 copper-binding protein [Streptomyces sp. Root66D1]
MGSCCTPDNSCSTTEATAVAVADSTATVYAVSGMTCGHCRTAITKSVSALDGVLAVDVDVDAGLVTVTTGGEPDDAAITAAVDDAGYELTGRAA